MRGMRAQGLFVWILVGLRKIPGIPNNQSINRTITYHLSHFPPLPPKKTSVPITLMHVQHIYPTGSYIHSITKKRRTREKEKERRGS